MGMFMIIAAMHIPIVFFIGKDAVLIIIDEYMRKTTSNTLIRKMRRRSHYEELEDD